MFMNNKCMLLANLIFNYLLHDYFPKTFIFACVIDRNVNILDYEYSLGARVYIESTGDYF